jgi:hypothetical protein
MGYAKRFLEEDERRGWSGDPNLFVCTRCTGDKFIRRFVFEHRESDHCSYCKRKSRNPCAAPVDLVLEHILDAFHTEYTEVSRDIAPQDPEDGKWMVSTWDTDDLLRKEYEELPTKSDGFKEKIASAFDDRLWCRKEPILLTEDEAWSSAWVEFCQLVKHVTRFMYFAPPDRDFRDFEEVHPSQLLEEVAGLVQGAGLIKDLEPGTEFVRIRTHPETEAYADAADLGPPPIERALNSNRMSPAGIPMFYGADCLETAISETAVGQARFGTAGIWRTTRRLKVLDLSAKLTMPSIFDRERRGLRTAIAFLWDFTNDLTKPVERDDSVHIEYVPTQIVTEYFRHKFRTNGGHRVEGIIYSSARREGHTACVLFCDSSGCCNALDKPKEQKTLLQLHSSKRTKWNERLEIQPEASGLD